jgi:EF hand
MIPINLVCASAVVALTAVGCQSRPSESAGDKDVKPEYDQTGRLAKLTFDRDGDGKIDTWGYMDGARVVRVEVDENGDGKVDRWEYHGGSGGSGGSANAGSGVDTTLERIERATRYDGKVSRREYFDHGVLTRVEEDTDGDGKIDKWETYSGGVLAVLALDTKGRGRPDRRLIYLPDGTLSRIETDPTGSGTFQPTSQ